MKKLTLTAVAVVAAAFAHGATVCGTGREMPRAYVPAMLSNGSLCMTADHLGGVPFPSQRTKSCRFSTGIFIAGRRLLYNLYGHGSYRLTLALDGKPLTNPDRWSQTLDPLAAKSIVTNVFGDVTRVVETFVAQGCDVIAIRQTFPGTDTARLVVGLDYTPHRDAEGRIVVGPWEDVPGGRAYSFTAYGKNIDKTRVTIRHAREEGALERVLAGVVFVKVGLGNRDDGDERFAFGQGELEGPLAVGVLLAGYPRGAVVAVGDGLLIGAAEEIMVGAAREGDGEGLRAVGFLNIGVEALEHGGRVFDGQIRALSGRGSLLSWDPRNLAAALAQRGEETNFDHKITSLRKD